MVYGKRTEKKWGSKMIKKLFLVILPFIFLSCSSPKHFKIFDVIQPVKLTAGNEKSITISDLFYAQNYDVKFLPNENISVQRVDSTVIFSPKNNFEGLTTVEFDLQGNIYYIPVYSRIIEKKRFSYHPNKKYKAINLFGSFNGWNRQSLPMKDENNDGVYDITIPLEPGRYEYKFYADGEEILDPENSSRIPNGIGGINSFVVVKDRHEGKLFLHKDSSYTINTGKEFIFQLESDQPGEVNCDEVVVLLDNELLSDKEIDCNGKRISIFLDNYQLHDNKLLRVAVSMNGQVSNMQMIPLHNEGFSWYDGIIYSLMVDRFSDDELENDKPIVHDSLSPKANYMGGDLQGIFNKINDGYFNDLGINILWISPVYQNPNEAFREYPAPHRYYSGYHGYWPTHHLMVEEHFGDMNKLKQLVKTAHDHKIKVLLDFVSNHVHEQHPFYKNHRDWFGKLRLPDGRLNLRFWDEYRLTTWFEPYLPSFDYVNSSEAVEAMTDNAVWWLKTTGADGFRHDAVKHVPNKFWRRLTQKIKEKIAIPQNKYVYQIGETFGDYDLVSSYVNPGQLSSQFNFELYNVASAVFLSKDRSFNELANEMHKTLEVYGSLHYMGNIMDSHDKVRYMAYADGDVTQSDNAVEIGWNNPPIVDDPYNYRKPEIYYAYMMSIPGLPVIYYGSEFGMTGAADPDNRRMMRFGDDLSLYEKELLGKVSTLVKLRNEHSALRRGDFEVLKADENIFAYLRSDFSERILIVINKNTKPQEVELKIPEVYSVDSARSLKSGNTIQVNNNTINVNVEDTGWEMITLK